MEKITYIRPEVYFFPDSAQWPTGTGCNFHAIVPSIEYFSLSRCAHFVLEYSGLAHNFVFSIPLIVVASNVKVRQVDIWFLSKRQSMSHFLLSHSLPSYDRKSTREKFSMRERGEERTRHTETPVRSHKCQRQQHPRHGQVTERSKIN